MPLLILITLTLLVFLQAALSLLLRLSCRLIRPLLLILSLTIGLPSLALLLLM